MTFRCWRPWPHFALHCNIYQLTRSITAVWMCLRKIHHFLGVDFSRKFVFFVFWFLNKWNWKQLWWKVGKLGSIIGIRGIWPSHNLTSKNVLG
jgi:hypothetical protein